MNENAVQLLEISSSGRQGSSVSRQLSIDLISALEGRHGSLDVTRRDVSCGVPFVDESWIEASFTPDEQRTQAHRDALAYSDELVQELKNADVLVIGVALYNFSIAATLKAWIDMITRAQLTFQYTENGPVGLLSGKKAYLVVATGGVPVGSPMDFATPYLRHLLSFIGITDTTIVAADQLNSDAESSMKRARVQINEAVRD